MRRIPSGFSVAAAVVTMLALVAVGSASASSSLLPGPVSWVLAVLVAGVLLASVVELGRRKARGHDSG